MGDYLCGQVHRWLKRNDDYKANGRDNIEMAFMYSECGNEWTEISSSIEGKLVPKEPLCCTNKGKFRRCDGSQSHQVGECGGAHPNNEVFILKSVVLLVSLIKLPHLLLPVHGLDGVVVLPSLPDISYRVLPSRVLELVVLVRLPGNASASHLNSFPGVPIFARFLLTVF